MKKAFLQLHIAVLLAGFSGILGRLISMNEGMIVWYRLLITSCTLWLIFGLLKKIKKISSADLVRVTFVGFIAALHWCTFYGAIKYSNVSVALVCFSSVGFFTALFEPLILKRRIQWTEILLGLLTMVGIYVIFHFDTQYKTGILIGIVSALLGSLFPILNKQFLERMNVETLLTYQQTGGWLTLSICLPFYLQWFPAGHFLPDWKDLGWLLILSWICSVVAFQFSFYALKKLSAFTINLSYNLEPVYGILLAFIVFKENQYLSKWFYIGFAIIAAALIIHLYMLLRAKQQIASHARQ
jgi:drug/metabolite transporter (DMT)-like permease